MRIDPAAWPFAATLAGVTLLAAWWSPWLAAVPLVLLLFTLNFFRDPERSVPSDPALILAPACGRVIRSDATRVSIFMNVFDVHVCRSPVAGQVVTVDHVPGKLLAAFREDASDHNERVVLVVQPAHGAPIRVALVAGLIARRIVCRVAAGQELAAGERIGIIRFGSRVDVDLPPGTAPSAAIGDRTVSGETALARRPAASI